MNPLHTGIWRLGRVQFSGLRGLSSLPNARLSPTAQNQQPYQQPHQQQQQQEMISQKPPQWASSPSAFSQSSHVPQSQSQEPQLTGHHLNPVAPDLAHVKDTGSNENRVRLVGNAWDLRPVSLDISTPIASLVLQTKSMGQVQVELIGVAALQALEHLKQGSRVAVTGRLARATAGNLFVQGLQLQLVVDKAPPGEGRNWTAARGGFGIRKWTPEYQTWLQTGLEAGRPLEDMASERGGGKVTRHTIAADLIEMVTKGFDGVNPTQIEPHVFDGSPGLDIEDLVAFVDSYMMQEQGIVRNADGSPKLTAIRDALLADAVMGPKVAAQEAVEGAGKSVTFNQIKLVLVSAVNSYARSAMLY